MRAMAAGGGKGAPKRRRSNGRNPLPFYLANLVKKFNIKNPGSMEGEKLSNIDTEANGQPEGRKSPRSLDKGDYKWFIKNLEKVWDQGRREHEAHLSAP
jgi:hypothetical protein